MSEILWIDSDKGAMPYLNELKKELDKSFVKHSLFYTSSTREACNLFIGLGKKELAGIVIGFDFIDCELREVVSALTNGKKESYFFNEGGWLLYKCIRNYDKEKPVVLLGSLDADTDFLLTHGLVSADPYMHFISRKLDGVYDLTACAIMKFVFKKVYWE